MSAPRRVIVIGASAGGVEALVRLVGGLPADLDAAVFVVLHMPPFARSRLPEILERVGRLPVVTAVDGQPIESGQIYVAPPDRHLLVRRDHLSLGAGPRENHSRPAIDPLFRSAAREYGPRVIAVVLSGTLYDGSAGLMAVKARGGVAVVQEPADAVAEGMPRSALRFVEADYVAPAAEIGPLLAELVRETPGKEGERVDELSEPIQEVIDDVIEEQAEDERPNDVTIYTCPECGGSLFQNGKGSGLMFRCHVGHIFAPEVLLGQKAEELEGALWACVRMLTEKATLTRQLASRTLHDPHLVSSRVVEQAELAERQASVIRELLISMPSLNELLDDTNGAAAS
jgi:two-component system chemotaxis response regulator CheB